MVTDQHWATGAQIKHSILSDCRKWQPEQNGLQFCLSVGTVSQVERYFKYFSYFIMKHSFSVLAFSELLAVGFIIFAKYCRDQSSTELVNIHIRPVDWLSVICRRRLHRRVVLTGLVCPYSRRHSVLPSRPRRSAVAAAVYRRADRWSRCLAAVSPSRSPPLKPPGDSTASGVPARTSSRQALARKSRWERLDRVLSAPFPLTTYHHRRLHRSHGLKPAWRSLVCLLTFRQLYRDFKVNIPVYARWWTNWQLLISCLR